jgi:hypothetical protein
MKSLCEYSNGQSVRRGDFMPKISALGRKRQENSTFKDSLVSWRV